MSPSTLLSETRDEIKNMAYSRQVSEFESTEPKESRKENVGRTGENRGKIVKKTGED
jgi:hypothetical protein